MVDMMCPFCQDKHPVGNGACTDCGDGCASDSMDMTEDATDPMDKKGEED